MGILAKLFGDCGKIRFEGVTEGGQAFSGTTQVESFNNSREDLEIKLKDVFYVETGLKAKDIKIVAFA